MGDFDLVNEHPEKTRLHGTDICTTNMYYIRLYRIYKDTQKAKKRNKLTNLR